MTINSLQLLKERAESRGKRRKELAEVTATFAKLRKIARSATPKPDDARADKKYDNAASVKELISEAQALTEKLADEQRAIDKIEAELEQARGQAFNRAMVLAATAAGLAIFAVAQVWK